tara:strand:- start:521 stop:706 length:186 start_codon:yes stop_codon:yes gene_type:complete
MRRQEYRRRDASRQGSQALRAWRLLLYRVFVSALYSSLNSNQLGSNIDGSFQLMKFVLYFF